MTRQLVPLLAVLAVTLAPAHAAVPEGDEAVFSDAAAWTVIVRTSVEMAFIEDDQGSGLGAGFVVDAKQRPTPMWQAIRRRASPFPETANMSPAR